MEKKEYETPSVTRIEIAFSDRIVAANCSRIADMVDCTPGSLEAS